MEQDGDGYFVGRTQELARIAQGAARSSVVVIYGVAGIGKTELACRATALLRATDTWRDARYVAARLDSRFESQLGTLLAMRIRGATIADLRDVDDDHDWFLTALEARQHVVVLDDAHVAPARVASLIDAVMRRVTNSLLVVTSQTELDLATAPIVVRLAPLPDADARDLVRRLAERMEVGALEEDAVVCRGAGSPFVLRALVSSEYSDGSNTTDPLRDSIAALALEDRNSLVRVVAVAPCPIRSPMIEGLADPASIARLRRRFLIGEAHGRLVVHDLVRDATLRLCAESELLEARRFAASRAHAAFAASRHPAHAIEAICLSTSAGDRATAELVLIETYPAIAAASLDHLLLPSLATLANAGSTEAFLLQVRVLLRMSRIDEAHDLLAAHGNDVELATRWQYHAFRGIAAQRRGQLARARMHFATARDVAPIGRMRARMTIHLADVLSLAGDCEAARVLLSEVVASPELRDSDRARILWSQALSYVLEERFVEVVSCVAKGSEMAERAGTQDLLGLFGMLHVIAASEAGDLLAARQTLASLTSKSSRPPLRADVEQFCRGVVELSDGDLASAASTLKRVYEVYRKHRDAALACVSGHFLGRALLASGDAAAAHTILTATAADAEAAGLNSLVATGRVYAARAALSLGRVTDAQTAVKALSQHPWSFLRAKAAAIEAYGAAMRGELPIARTLIRRALDEALEREPLRSDLLVDAAEIETMGGDPAIAIVTARTALQQQATFGRRYYQARALAALVAGLLARRGAQDLVVARRHLDELAALAASTGIQHLTTRANLLGTLLENPSAGGDTITAPVALGPEILPGINAYLRFIGARTPRLWISRREGGQFGDEAHLARARAECDLVVDTVANVLWSRHGAREIRNRAAIVDLVASLAERRGVVVSAEDLYRSVWGASDYHPLRNRNTLYIALNRARRALAELLPGRDVIVRARDGWLIPAELDVCVVRHEPIQTNT